MRDSFAPDTMLTMTQALQLGGLLPCFFLVAFLLSLARRNRDTLVPALYFLSLACGFALPLLYLHPAWQADPWSAGALLMGESMLVALSFLLILQFLTGRLPRWPYWLVLAIPLLGGGELIYLTLIQDREACRLDHDCFDAETVKMLYNIFGSALIFLLLVYYSSRLAGRMAGDIYRKHKYWLVVSLILVHLAVLGVDLAQLAERLDREQGGLISVILRLSFIYLVLTSLFRVFSPALAAQALEAVSVGRRYNPELDRPHVEKILFLLEKENLYREAQLNRAALAQKVGISEQHLSRVINGHFARNFRDLVNGYRLEEAKRRLRSETTPVTAIAFETGFNSIASFNRVFKDKIGLSPTEFRNGGRENS